MPVIPARFRPAAPARVRPAAAVITAVGELTRYPAVGRRIIVAGGQGRTGNVRTIQEIKPATGRVTSAGTLPQGAHRTRGRRLRSGRPATWSAEARPPGRSSTR